MPQALAGLVGFTLLIGALGLGRRANRSGGVAITALVAMYIAWGLALVFYGLTLIKYSSTSTTAWLLVYGSLAAFTIGAFAGEAVFTRIGPLEPLSPEVSNARLLSMWLVTLGLGLIGAGLYVHAVDVTVGWHALLDHPATVRTAESTPAFQHSYTLFGKLATYLGELGLLLWTLALRTGALRGRARILIPLGLVGLVPYAFISSRVLLMSMLVVTGVFHLLWGSSLTMRRMAIAASCALAGLAGVFILAGARLDKSIASHPEIRTRLTVPALKGLAMPDLYLSGEVPLFTRLLSDPNRPSTAGGLTFLPVIKLARELGAPVTPPRAHTPYYSIPFSTFNLPSWLGPFYTDYGAVGCIVIPGLLGFLFTLVVSLALHWKTLLTLWWASVACIVLLLSPLDKISGTLFVTFIVAGGALMCIFDSSSRVVLRRLFHPNVRRRHPLYARVLLSSTASLAALATVAVAASWGVAAPLAKERDLERLLTRLSTEVQRTQHGVYPARSALVTQLNAANPGISFLALATPYSLVPMPNTVGVFAGGNRYTLTLHTSDGLAGEITATGESKHRLQWGPTAMRSTPALRDPSFAPPLPGAWRLSTQAGARLISQASPDGSSGGLALSGDGSPLRRATYIAQRVPSTQAKTPGYRFELSELVNRRHLSRSIAVELRLNLVGGGYTFHTSSIPRGTDLALDGKTRWLPIHLAVTATRPVESVDILPLDTGRVPVKGRVALKSVGLAISAPSPAST